VKLDALLHNERTLSFYRALGIADYSLVMRRLPTNASRQPIARRRKAREEREVADHY